MPVRIVDDEQRRDATQVPPALWVRAADGRLHRCSSSTMHLGIASSSRLGSCRPALRTRPDPVFQQPARACTILRNPTRSGNYAKAQEMDARPDPLPRLRALEILRLPEDGGPSYLLRDPQGYTDAELVLSEAALFVAAHIDGEHTLSELQDNFAERYGNPPPAEQVDGLIARLQEAHMLETESFFDRQRLLHGEFNAAPTRAPAHQGICYPEDPDEAVQALQAIFQKANGLEEDGARPEGSLRGLVAPHIDLRVGGPCSALAFELIADSPHVKTVFVLGTAHGCPHPAWLVLPKPYETPMGPVPVDEDACRRLIGTVEHGPDDLFYHRKEHSVEFQAVFLAYLRRQRPDLRMVPILCGSLRELGSSGESPGDDPFLDELGRILDERGESAVVVAGADLAHVGPRFGDPSPLDQNHLELLETKDRDTLAAVTRGDALAFYGAVTEGGDPRRICGLSPIYGALASLPRVRGKVLRYEQAIEPTGTVTYASVGLWA